MNNILSNLYTVTAAVLFAAVSVFHVVSCFFQNNFPQKAAANISKALIMPALATAALCAFYAAYPASARTADPLSFTAAAHTVTLLMCALAAGWIGDILLIRPISRKKFFGGLSFFLAGHVFYLVIIISELLKSPFQVPHGTNLHLNGQISTSSAFFFYFTGIILCVLYALIEITLLRILKKPHGAKGAAVTVYSSMLLIINGCCLFGFFFVTHPSFIYFTAGNFLFMISDSLLAFSLFRKNTRYSRQAVMITYIAAQIFLVYGVLSAVIK